MLRGKWRPSHRSEGGRPWITPSDTPEQLAAVRREAKRGQAPPGLVFPTAEVKVMGHMGAAPHQVVAKLMEILGHHAGTPFTESDDGPRATEPTWQWLAKTNPSAAVGRIRVSLVTEEQLCCFTTAVHGRAIQLGADLISITYTSELADAEGNDLIQSGSRSKNGSRGGGRRAHTQRA